MSKEVRREVVECVRREGEMKNPCTKEIQIKVGTSIEWKQVKGNECKCEKPDRSYQGTKGCNLSWETACK